MGRKEKSIIGETLTNLPANKRLFRINAGVGWNGKIVKHGKDVLILKNPRPFYGAPAGWPDLVGWETIEITKNMVGKNIAVFCAEEVKATGKLSSAQRSFRDLLIKMGGRFKVLKK